MNNNNMMSAFTGRYGHAFLYSDGRTCLSGRRGIW